MAQGVSEREQQILQFLSLLPQRIVTNHGIENIAEFLLYDICNHDNFGVKKAAFFVDSPEFNCFKGVAGIDKENHFSQVHWESQEDFSNHMQVCSFNQAVRTHMGDSIHNSPYDPVKAQALAKNMNFQNPKFHSWPMKYNNRGFLVYESSSDDNADDHLFNVLHLFSFCPVF